MANQPPKVSLSRYLIVHALLTALSAAAAWAFVAIKGAPALLAPALGGVFASSLVKLGAYLLQRPAMQGDNAQFTQRVMAGTVLKMVASLGLILVVYGLNENWLIPFTIAYFFLYFGLTGFEVIALQSNLRPNSEPSQGNS